MSFHVLVNFEKVFPLLVGSFIIDFEHPLLIVNAIKYYLMAYLRGTTNTHYIYWSISKHSIKTVAMASSMW